MISVSSSILSAIVWVDSSGNPTTISTHPTALEVITAVGMPEPTCIMCGERKPDGHSRLCPIPMAILSERSHGHLSRYVYSLRCAAGYKSQAAFARALGVTPQYYGLLENGKQRTTFATAQRIAGLLHTTIDKVLV